MHTILPPLCSHFSVPLPPLPLLGDAPDSVLPLTIARCLASRRKKVLGEKISGEKISGEIAGSPGPGSGFAGSRGGASAESVVIVLYGLAEVVKGAGFAWWPREAVARGAGSVCFVVIDDGGGERILLDEAGLLGDFLEQRGERGAPGAAQPGSLAPGPADAPGPGEADLPDSLDVAAAMIKGCRGKDERRALLAVSLSQRGLTREEIAAVSGLTPNQVRDFVDRMELTTGFEYARTLALPSVPSIRLAERVASRVILGAFEELHTPVFDRMVEYFSSSEASPERQLAELPTLLDLAGLNDLVCVMLADRLVVKLLALSGRDPAALDRDDGWASAEMELAKLRARDDGDGDGDGDGDADNDGDAGREDAEAGDTRDAGGAELGLIRLMFANAVDVAARGLSDDAGPRILEAALKSLEEDKGKDADVRARAAEELAEMVWLGGFTRECLALVNEAVSLRSTALSGGSDPLKTLRYARDMTWHLRLSESLKAPAAFSWQQVREAVSPLLDQPRGDSATPPVPRKVAEEAAAVAARAILSSCNNDTALLEEADRVVRVHARRGSRMTLAVHAEVLVCLAGIATSKIKQDNGQDEERGRGDGGGGAEPGAEEAGEGPKADRDAKGREVELEREREEERRDKISLDALHVAEKALAAARAYTLLDGHPMVRTCLTYLALINESLSRWERAYVYHHQLAYEVSPLRPSDREAHEVRDFHLSRLAELCRLAGRQPPSADFPADPGSLPLVRDLALATPGARINQLALPRILADAAPEPPNHQAVARAHRAQAFPTVNPLAYLGELRQRAETELSEVDVMIREAIARKDVEDLRGLTKRRVRLLEALQKLERK